VLTPQAVEKLFVTLRLLAERGCSILYISHKLDEIRALCHTCTVLRGGRVTGVADPRQETSAGLSRLMIGAEPPKLQHREVQRGAVALEARGLALERQDQFGVTLDGIDLQVHAGEVVGIAGVSGNGQQELLAALSGEDRRARPGSVLLLGGDVARASAGRRRKQGLHFVPEERLGRGAVPTMGLAHNLLLTRREPVRAGGWLDLRRMTAMTQSIIERFNVKAGGPASAARSLSGGNLQKYIVGREIDARPKVLVVAQPTWGVDVGASAQIRGELLALRDAGCAVLVVSEELDELFEITDRLYVIARGRLSPSIATSTATPERIGQWMSGLWTDGQGTAPVPGEVAHAPA
jgi:simple sugar transport system ATP-binding protein